MTGVRIYVCQCRMRDTVNESLVDACPNVVSGPDEPMCSDCLRHGHHVSPRQVPLSDPARRLTR